MVQVEALGDGQFAQPPNVPLAAAVNVIGPVPVAKLRPHVVEQIKPEGDTETVPVPLPRNLMVNTAAPLLLPVKQITPLLMFPVTIAPDELRPLASLLVLTVAEMIDAPQTFPVALINPAE